jgi:thiosulfate/3-mercaptopyruvate sulfurtransferase
MTNYANPEVLVDTQWLADNLNNPKLKIVEVDIAEEAYRSGHIYGAIFWNGFTSITKPDFRVQLDRTAVESLLSRSGITKDTTVIIYSSNISGAPFAFWYLKLFGHQDVKILNGGRKKWIAEGRSLTLETPNIEETTYEVTNLDTSLRVLPDEVKTAINNPTNYVLVDTRTPQEYSGEWFWYTNQAPKDGERAGHIPSAVNILYEVALNEDDTFKSREELSILYGDRGVTSEKKIIPYCTVGARSSFTWFVLKYLLGYPNIRNYDGSWNEWSSLPNSAIEISRKRLD